MPEYDPRDVIVVFNGHVITGYATGTFVTCMREADAYTKSTGRDSTTRVKGVDRTGNVVVTLQSSSPSNDQLSTFARLDELSGTGKGPLTVRHARTGRSLWSAEEAWIRKIADGEFSTDDTNRVWTLDTAEFQAFVGGHL